MMLYRCVHWRPHYQWYGKVNRKTSQLFQACFVLEPGWGTLLACISQSTRWTSQGRIQWKWLLWRRGGRAGRRRWLPGRGGWLNSMSCGLSGVDFWRQRPGRGEEKTVSGSVHHRSVPRHVAPDNRLKQHSYASPPPPLSPTWYLCFQPKGISGVWVQVGMKRKNVCLVCSSDLVVFVEPLSFVVFHSSKIQIFYLNWYIP